MERPTHLSSVALQGRHKSDLFTSYVNDDKLTLKVLSKFPDSSRITFTIRKLDPELEEDRTVSLRFLALTSIPYGCHEMLLFSKRSNRFFLQRSFLRN